MVDWVFLQNALWLLDASMCLSVTAPSMCVPASHLLPAAFLCACVHTYPAHTFTHSHSPRTPHHTHPTHPPHTPATQVTTVDKYQGQQNDYVLLSLVRTRHVGHLRDVRRLVVAMSRARLGLYVFGRRELFGDCYELQPTFRQLLGRPVQVRKGGGWGAEGGGRGLRRKRRKGRGQGVGRAKGRGRRGARGWRGPCR